MMTEAHAGTDRDLLERVLKLSPTEAAKTLRRSRQALYTGLSAKKRTQYFRPEELAELYMRAARDPDGGTDRKAFLRFVEETRGADIARDVRKMLRPELGAFASMAIVLPDYPHMSGRNVLARDALLDSMLDRPAAAVTAYLPSREDAVLFLADVRRAGIETARVAVRTGTAIAAIPPLLVLDSDQKARVFGVSEGIFRPSDYYGGARLALLLNQLTENSQAASSDADPREHAGSRRLPATAQ